jgi:hypothetical protein
MPFPPKVKEDALVYSARCCCLCRKFAGVATNVHHIIAEADGGPDTLENAIVLCLDCHAEVGHYNPKHPIGNKYSQSELRRHRDEWWRICRDAPAPPPIPAPAAKQTEIIEEIYGKINRLYAAVHSYVRGLERSSEGTKEEKHAVAAAAAIGFNDCANRARIHLPESLFQQTMKVGNRCVSVANKFTTELADHRRGVAMKWPNFYQEAEDVMDQEITPLYEALVKQFRRSLGVQE